MEPANPPAHRGQGFHLTACLLGALALGLAGCREAPREYTRLHGFAQGTTYSIVYLHPQGERLTPAIEALLGRVDRSMSIHNPESSIVAFNRSAEGAHIDSLLARVVQLSLEYSRQTQGAFDITVGPLARAWGFHGQPGDPPDSAEVNRLRALTGYPMIRLDGHHLHKKKPGVQIDANAIGQGFTVDLLAEMLQAEGVSDYLVELGGEIRTRGVSPRGGKWVVGIDRPDDHAVPGANLQARLALSGESLATSGSYRKFYLRDGQRYSHTIDPATGHPVRHNLLSATVLDSTATRADALATAFMVMGVEGARRWLDADTSGVQALLVYAEPEGGFGVWATDGMRDRMLE